MIWLDYRFNINKGLIIKQQTPSQKNFYFFCFKWFRRVDLFLKSRHFSNEIFLLSD